MCEMPDKEVSKLLYGLRAIEAFTSFVNLEFKIKSEVKEQEEKVSHTGDYYLGITPSDQQVSFPAGLSISRGFCLVYS